MNTNPYSQAPTIPWPTPTAWPTANPSTLLIDTEGVAAGGQEAMINMAESGVSTWQVANSQGTMDTLMTLIIIIALVVSMYSIIKHARSI